MVTLHNPIPEAAEEVTVHPGKIEHPRPARRPACPVDCDDSDSSACCAECDDSTAWHASILFNKDLQDDTPASQRPQKKKIKVRNVSDRPIQVGSHYHFAEVNPGLKVIENSSDANVEPELAKCDEAKGRRLNIAAGKSVRFEPGDECWVELVEFQGEAKGRRVSKIQGLRMETVDEP
ncbi:urease subunit beta [Streptomyces sp. NBC_01013]|uniref:urease subunit beta n=1 Tax=Streptomyces sp. NBC_01013 TaxID=2903718 RepID=UPI003865F7E2|nr:urease subunit beta [Streptomyces sp. NBC_01013]